MAQTETSESSEVPEQRELVRKGDVLPIKDGRPWRDAPEWRFGPGCGEATATELAKQEGSPESKMQAHVGGHGLGGIVETATDATATEPGTWPRRHADLDAIAAEHGLTFSEDGLTADAKIEELAKMNIQPPSPKS